MYLKLRQPNMRGPAVVRLQEMLNMDYIDGVFGIHTKEHVESFQWFTDLRVDGIAGPKTEEALRHASAASYLITCKDKIVDLTGKHDHPLNYRAHRKIDLRGMTLHQTGCAMGDSPHRWGNVNAHYGATQSGIAYRINPLTDFIWHGHGLSHISGGVEVEGNFEGLTGKRYTLWSGGGGPHYLTEPQKKALDLIFYDIKEQFALLGKEWTNIYAHRESSEDRIGDPGEEIWKNIVLPWAFRLDLDRDRFDGGRYYKKGTGHVIPKGWDSLRAGSYYEQR